MKLETLISAALEEDLMSTGDITSQAVFTDETCNAALFSKDSGVLAGKDVFSRVFAVVDGNTSVRFKKDDGETLLPGEKIAEIEGKVLSVLTAERTAINFLSYLSGIATKTREFCDALPPGSDTLVLDTRKTLPGYRSLAKYAVAAGGGKNHRMGLYDMVMIKDNHIDAAGSITEAVFRVREAYGERYRIEVECRTLSDIKEAVDLDVDVVMLDNMDEETVREAVQFKSEEVQFEVSGNMDLEKISRYSIKGIDFISIGALTHSVRAFDFSLRIDREERA